VVFTSKNLAAAIQEDPPFPSSFIPIADIRITAKQAATNIHSLHESHIKVLPRSFQRTRPILSPCLAFRNSLFFIARSRWPLAQPPSWSITPCRLSPTSYSTYSQPLSISGNLSLHHRVQTGSGAHPASFPMSTRGSFPVGKAAGA
jgi:hypothetical protein